jgi:hypothetical protein
VSPRTARPHRAARLGLLVPAVLAVVALAACAERVAPGAAEYRPLPFHSQVTVTGNDVPGPLRVREASLAFVSGDSPLTVRRDDVLQVVFKAWINGHGKLTGHWERDGTTIDRVSVFITYGEALEVRLGGREAFPTENPGRHEIRFVIDQPTGGPEAEPVAYVVEDLFR